MTKTFLLITLLSITILLQAQEKCMDVIHPTEGKSVIFNCCINDVRNGNMVFYTKDGKSSIILATAITKDGQYIKLEEYKSPKTFTPKPVNKSDGLYKGYDYNYYKTLYKKSISLRNQGIFLTLFGFGFEVAGIVIVANNNNSDNNAGAILFLCGTIPFNIGMPLWITGGVKSANNRKAMEECKRVMNLSLGMGNNGIGLALNF